MLKDKILTPSLSDGESVVLEKDMDQKLIVTYSIKRAKKDVAKEGRIGETHKYLKRWMGLPNEKQRNLIKLFNLYPKAGGPSEELRNSVSQLKTPNRGLAG